MNRNSRRSFRSSRFSLKLRNSKPIEYEYVNNFSNTDLKTCVKLDKQNNLLYEKNVKLYDSILKKLEKNNALFQIKNAPDPPRNPSNEEYFKIHEMRTQKVDNTIQTAAVLYLLSLDYKLVIDAPRSKIPEISDVYSTYFEPYMAVNLAKKKALERNENFLEIIKMNYLIDENKVLSREMMVEMPGESSVDESFHVKVPLRHKTETQIKNNRRYSIQGRHFPDLNSLRVNEYDTRNNVNYQLPSEQELRQWKRGVGDNLTSMGPVPSAPPPLPLPHEESHIYPMDMGEPSSMLEKSVSLNNLDNYESRSVISEPPSYNGVMNSNGKKKAVSIVINNQ